MKDPFEAMPSPFELADKGKSATVTMSLRIKQTTKDFFDEQAKAIADNEEVESNKDNKDKSGKTSASSLINTLLDWYVESYTQQVAKTPVSTVLRPYLETMAEKMAAMDDESLIYRAFRSGREAAMEDALIDTDPKHIVRTWRDAVTGEHYSEYRDVLLSYPLMQSSLDLNIATIPIDTKDKRAYFANVADNWRYEVGVEMVKWPIVAAMADNYVRKVKELTGQSEDEFSFSTEKFRELVNVVNSTNDRKELAMNLAKFFADYAEQVYE